MIMELTQKLLSEMFLYDNESGVLIRKEKNSRFYGNIAGYKRSNGYIRIRIKNKDYYAHRIAWIITYGYNPEQDIDHINGRRDDNRIENLREVSKSCNSKNSKKRVNNTSGVTGVYKNRSGTWSSRISSNHKNKYLGAFRKFEDAVMARWRSEVENNYPNCKLKSDAYLYLVNKGIINEVKKC